MKATRSICIDPLIAAYIEREKIKKRRTFSAESQELLEAGIKARDGVDVMDGEDDE